MTAPWFDAFAAGIADGEPTYRRCGSCGAAALPPRRTCPECGDAELTDATLSSDARVVAATEIQVTTPRFSGETPYTVLVAAFDEGVRLTGQLRGADEVSRGDAVELGVERRGDEDWLVTFTPSSA